MPRPPLDGAAGRSLAVRMGNLQTVNPLRMAYSGIAPRPQTAYLILSARDRSCGLRPPPPSVEPCPERARPSKPKQRRSNYLQYFAAVALSGGFALAQKLCGYSIARPAASSPENLGPIFNFLCWHRLKFLGLPARQHPYLVSNQGLSALPAPLPAPLPARQHPYLVLNQGLSALPAPLPAPLPARQHPPDTPHKAKLARWSDVCCSSFFCL